MRVDLKGSGVCLVRVQLMVPLVLIRSPMKHLTRAPQVRTKLLRPRKLPTLFAPGLSRIRLPWLPRRATLRIPVTPKNVVLR